MSSRSRRLADGRNTARAPSVDSNVSTVRVSGTRKRLSSVASRREASTSSDVVHSRRPTRGPKKRYVESESSDDDDDDENDDDDDDEEEEEEEEEEEHDVIKVGDSDVDMDALGDEDAEGEAEDMDIDAEGDPELGEEDAEGDIDMDVVAPTAAAAVAAAPPPAKVAKPPVAAAPSRGVGRPSIGNKQRNKRRSLGGRRKGGHDEDEPTDEAESAAEGEINASVEVAGRDDDEADAEGEEETGPDHHEEEDAEGEEIEVVDEEEDEEEGGEGVESDITGSRAGTPDLSKMTRRQRARFEETPQEYMKLSDEVQVKKHFTAEELSMRRAEMARRRRNLSEKRNEEVKAETINKLLKRQAPKTTKKNALADDSGDEDGQHKPPAVFIRWVSNKQGSRVAVTNEVMAGPAGDVFRAGSGTNMGGPGRKMVEEVL